MKTCTKCNSTKERTDFYARGRSPDGLEAWCKVCRLAHNRAWRDKNIERHKVLVKKNHEDNKEAHKAAFRKRYEANKPLYLAKYYERENRTKIATPSWYNKESVRAIYSMARFLTEVVGRQYHVDHVVPLKSDKVCGLHVQGNLSIIPARENWSKFNTSWPDMA